MNKNIRNFYEYNKFFIILSLVAFIILILLLILIYLILPKIGPGHHTYPPQPHTYTKQIFNKCSNSTSNCLFEYYPTTSIETIKSDITNSIKYQGGDHSRWEQAGSFAFIFHPGIYDFKGWNLPVGFQMSIRGLGALPSDTVFKNCSITIQGCPKNCPTPVTNIFWRDLENITITNGSDILWYTSQECPIRRVITNGKIMLDRGQPMWASGGFIANTKATDIIAYTQQQFCVKNTDAKIGKGGTMNWVSINIKSPDEDKNICKAGSNGNAYSVVNNNTVYDKPYLIEGGSIIIPRSFSTNGVDYTSNKDIDSGDVKVRIDYSNIHIVYPGDSVDNINKKIGGSGKDTKNAIIFTSGSYTFDKPINITNDNTVVLGVGWPVINAGKNTTPLFNVTGSNCVLASMLVDAGIGGNPSSLIHFSKEKGGKGGKLFDICCRIITPKDKTQTSSCKSMLTIDQDDTYAENIWLWRADHGDSNTDWYRMNNPNGLIVNGNNVRIFCLSVEHQSEIMTQWNGENGECYFYQSEFPYDGVNNGSASYVVNNSVNKHTLVGGGAYYVMSEYKEGRPKQVEAAFVCPEKSGVKLSPVVFAGPQWDCCYNFVTGTIKRGDKLSAKGMIC